MAPTSVAAGPAGSAAVLALLDRWLPEAEVGAYRRSVHETERRVVVRHPLPDAVRARVEPALERVAAETGWTLALHPATSQQALVDCARALLPEGVGAGAPSFYAEVRRLSLPVDREVAAAEALDEAFRRQTGWHLALPLAEACAAPAAAAAPGGAPALRPDEVKALVAALFEDVAPGLGPIRTSFPDGAVVLHFAAPSLARLHEGRLAALAERAGRAVRVHPHASPPHVAELIGPRLPRHWEVIKAPTWVPQEDAARVVLWTLPPEAEQAEVLAEIQDALGIRVTVVQDT